METGFGIEPYSVPCEGSPTGLQPAADASRLNQPWPPLYVTAISMAILARCVLWTPRYSLVRRQSAGRRAKVQQVLTPGRFA